MLNSLPIENILFLDIETVPQKQDYDSLDESFKKMWDTKVSSLQKSGRIAETPDEYYRSAGIYAEFGRIICISVGLIKGKEFRIKSFFGDNEAQLLMDFASLLRSHYSKAEHLLCAHNGKEFDFPYLSRRMLVNGIKLPKILDTAAKKPWEVQHLDTMELWKFGDYKSYTSLNLLATIFNIPTPKDDIDGSKVYDVYYTDKNLERIVTYCQKDVLTVAQIIMRMKGEPLFESAQVIISS